MPIIPAADVERFAVDLLHRGGLSPDEAELVGRSLAGANLRGHDSHGLMRIPFYLDTLRKGEVVAGAELEVVREAPSILVADGHWGFGQTQAQRLTRRCIDKAQSAGVAVGTLRRTSHVGRLGEYCEMAAEAGLCSMMMVNTHGFSRRVAPVGGKAPRLGTNPLAIGAPNGDRPIILDMGTSATAEGKVRVKKIAGQLCPDGWLLDCEGRPTTDPNTLYGDPPGTIRPMGGDQAYKGFGLGLMVEIFSGALSGGVCIREKPITQNGNCVFLLLIDPAHLGGKEHFLSEVSQLADFIVSCPRIDGVPEITLPGDPERRMLAQRTAQGVPFDDGNWKQLADLAATLHVAVPGSTAAAG